MLLLWEQLNQRVCDSRGRKDTYKLEVCGTSALFETVKLETTGQTWAEMEGGKFVKNYIYKTLRLEIRCGTKDCMR
jgi:hypothetical protein